MKYVWNIKKMTLKENTEPTIIINKKITLIVEQFVLEKQWNDIKHLRYKKKTNKIMTKRWIIFSFAIWNISGKERIFSGSYLKKNQL